MWPTETDVENPLTRLSQYLRTSETQRPAAALVRTMVTTRGAANCGAAEGCQLPKVMRPARPRRAQARVSARPRQRGFEAAQGAHPKL